MQRLEVSGAVRPLYGSLGVRGLKLATKLQIRVELIMCHRYVGNDIETKTNLRKSFSVLCEGKGKGNLISLQARVAQRVGRGIALLFHDRGTRRR